MSHLFEYCFNVLLKTVLCNTQLDFWLYLNTRCGSKRDRFNKEEDMSVIASTESPFYEIRLSKKTDHATKVV